MKPIARSRLRAALLDSVVPAAVIAAVSHLLLAGNVVAGVSPPSGSTLLHSLLVGAVALAVLSLVGRRRAREIAREAGLRASAGSESSLLALKLDEALAQLRADPRLLCMCSWCKSIRDPSGEWRRLEGYLEEHLRADFTHGVCPECMRVEYPDLFGQSAR